jgi:hypothetical protein
MIELVCDYCTMLNRIAAVQECDATKVNSSNDDDYINKK